MPMVSRLFTAVFTFCLLAAGAVAQAPDAPRPELRIGTEATNPPYVFVDDDGTLRGFEVEIVNDICAEIRMRCRLIPRPFSELIQALQDRDIDAIAAGMLVTEERKRMLDFTDVYANFANRFIARRNVNIDVSAKGLTGKKIGVMQGTSHARYVTDKFGTVARIRRYTDIDELFVDLTLGRSDTILLSIPRARISFLQTRLGADFEFVGPEIADEQWFGAGAGMAVRKGDDELRQTLNSGLAAIRAQGSYNRILSRYVD
jgi:arginine/ornithine transport system substrate-binding protein